jgi:hypothetical protein
MDSPVGDIPLNPDLGQRLRNRTIALTLAGSRRFRFPNGLGMMRYEGARIVVFQDDLEPDRKSLMDSLSSYDRKDAPYDPTSPLTQTKAGDSPDNQAVGVVFWVDPRDRNSARLKYLSANKNAIGIAHNSWGRPEGKFTCKIRQDGPGVVDISIATEKPNGERDVELFLFLLLNALGHGICL